MKIAIAGYGYVGRAYAAILQNYHETQLIDPKHFNGKKIGSDVDAVIICVATPVGLKGACNMIHVKEVIQDCPDVPILIKSTISLEGWEYLQSRFNNKNISFSPEFLPTGAIISSTGTHRPKINLPVSSNPVSGLINSCPCPANNPEFL